MTDAVRMSKETPGFKRRETRRSFISARSRWFSMRVRLRAASRDSMRSSKAATASSLIASDLAGKAHRETLEMGLEIGAVMSV